jgi:hypothetical protein
MFALWLYGIEYVEIKWKKTMDGHRTHDIDYKN